jgi:hypothetical protein
LFASLLILVCFPHKDYLGMGALTPEMRAKMIADTKSAAVAFVEDMRYIQRVLSAKEVDAGEIRRASAVLRRLLIDDDLKTLAAPRMGRIMLTIPDNNYYYKLARDYPYDFFGTGAAGESIFGANMHQYSLRLRGSKTPKQEFAPTGLTEVVQRLDTFVTQRVICLRGEWVSRGDVIKYAANIASGVHSGSPKDAKEKLIAQARGCVTVTMTDKGPHAQANFDAVLKHTPLTYSPKAIDPVLLELLATARYLARSEDVKKLEEIICQELGIPKPSTSPKK